MVDGIHGWTYGGAGTLPHFSANHNWTHWLEKSLFRGTAVGWPHGKRFTVCAGMPVATRAFFPSVSHACSKVAGSSAHTHMLEGWTQVSLGLWGNWGLSSWTGTLSSFWLSLLVPAEFYFRLRSLCMRTFNFELSGWLVICTSAHPAVQNNWPINLICRIYVCCNISCFLQFSCIGNSYCWCV